MTWHARGAWLSPGLSDGRNNYIGLTTKLHGWTKGTHINASAVTGSLGSAVQLVLLHLSCALLFDCAGRPQHPSGCLGSCCATTAHQAQPGCQQGRGPGARHRGQQGAALPGSHHGAHHCSRGEANTVEAACTQAALAFPITQSWQKRSFQECRPMASFPMHPPSCPASCANSTPH